MKTNWLFFYCSFCVCMPYPKKTSVFDQRCMQRTNFFYFFQKFWLCESVNYLNTFCMEWGQDWGSLFPPVPQEQQIYSLHRKNWFSIELLLYCRWKIRQHMCVILFLAASVLSWVIFLPLWWNRLLWCDGCSLLSTWLHLTLTKMQAPVRGFLNWITQGGKTHPNSGSFEVGRFTLNLGHTFC